MYTPSGWKYWLQLLATGVVFLLALAALSHLLAEYHWREIRVSIAGIPRFRIAVSLLLIALNYVVLIGYDYLALRAIGRQLPLSRVAVASFLGFVASFNIGTLFGGVPVRTRVYSREGLSAMEIAEVIVRVGMGFWLGVLGVGGTALLLSPPDAAPLISRLGLSSQTLGLLLLAPVAGWLCLASFYRRPIQIRNWEARLPSPAIAFGQFAIAALDFCLAAGALYVLLPADLAISFPHFVAMYCLALIAVVMAHVPGGLGVFEAVLLTLCQAHEGHLIASLLTFRVLYYLVPLCVAGLLLAVDEGAAHREKFRSAKDHANRLLGPWATLLAALYAAVSGLLLLFSGATPSMRHRLTLLDGYLPLAVVELAHFMNGLIGLCLLIIVPALRRRLDSAWLVLLALLGAGVVSSLLKGFDYEEALFLAAGFVFFWPCRERFYRRGHLLNQSPDLTWSTVMVFALLATIWLGFYSYRRVPYHEDVWWTAAIHADAPRFLRSSVGLVVAAVALGIWQLCAPHRPKQALPSEQDLSDAARIVGQESRTSPHLALVGDKSLFFSESRQAFLAYAIEGRTWVVMGDPVGLEEEHAELIWDFRELVDRYAGRAVFYEVGAEFFPLYVDQGYSLLKLGEEARVWLPSFSLAGPESKQFRQARSRMAREHCRFEIVPAERVPDLLPQLQRISDEWLDAKNAAEKGFSLGYFDADYLQRCPLAVVWRGEEVLAFANLWLVESKEELSMDLMRHAAQAPSGAMEFLIVELLLWGKAEGYRWFNLGMAPLSGLENRPLSPLWNKVLQLVYEHGQRFYSFVGLRNYKEKFDPQWTPRYLASFGGWELPGILADVTRLIARKRFRAKSDTVLCSDDTVKSAQPGSD